MVRVRVRVRARARVRARVRVRVRIQTRTRGRVWARIRGLGTTRVRIPPAHRRAEAAHLGASVALARALQACHRQHDAKQPHHLG